VNYGDAQREGRRVGFVVDPAMTSLDERIELMNAELVRTASGGRLIRIHRWDVRRGVAEFSVGRRRVRARRWLERLRWRLPHPAR
jgi:hypothetical protein